MIEMKNFFPSSHKNGGVVGVVGLLKITKLGGVKYMRISESKIIITIYIKKRIVKDFLLV